MVTSARNPIPITKLAADADFDALDLSAAERGGASKAASLRVIGYTWNDIPVQ